MDNITHSLVGLVVGEIAFQTEFRKKKSNAKNRRAAFWLMSLLANNFPDLDFLYVGVTPGSLGYLLHHRGHTHTLVASVPIALFLLGLFWIGSRHVKPKWTVREWKWLSSLALLGPLLHVALDSLNSYGVHPFWPFDNRWFYGDSVFIIEPWLWVTLVAPLLFVETRKSIRWTLYTILFGAIALCWFTRFVPHPIAIFLVLWSVGLLFWLKRQPPLSRATYGATFSVAIVLFFMGASHQVRAQLEQQYPENKFILTPMPANPFCWSVISIQNSKDQYVLRRGSFALWPSWITQDYCAAFGGPSAPALLRSVAASEDPRLKWFGKFEMPREQLQTIARGDCVAAAYLRFSRAPFFLNMGKTLVAGDLRFAWRRGPSFAEIPIRHAVGECPKRIPPWEPPRSDVLKSKHGQKEDVVR